LTAGISVLQIDGSEPSNSSWKPGAISASCAARVEQRLNRVDGAQATVNFATEKASIDFDGDLTSPTDLVAAVRAAGYDAKATPTVTSRRTVGRDPDLVALWRRWLISAILALPVADTVKTAGKDEAGVQRIAATQDRSQLWLAQTPQMFRAGLLAQALAQAPGATDEAAAVEKMGLRPRLVLGSRQNLKVTYPEDVAIAQAILKT